MPNNLIFNNVADQLLTQIYGTDGSTTRAIKTDNQGRLEIVGTFTAVMTPSTISAMLQLNGITGTGEALTFNTSAYNMYSYYIKNLGTANFTVKLQVSPTPIDSYFVDDKSGNFSIDTTSQSMAVIIPKHYMNYTRVYYEAPPAGITAEIWFSGKT